MFNLKTKSISVSREILFLNVNYGKCKSCVENIMNHIVKNYLSKNDYLFINIKTNIISQVHHKVYNPEEIITEREKPSEIKTEQHNQ